MHRGYVPMWRKLKDSTFYRDSEAVHLWLHLLFEAQHKPKKEWFRGIEVDLLEGEFTTGRKRLSSETGISESKIQRLLKKFEKCHMIEQQTNSANRLISIVNYKSHQVGEQQTNNVRTIGEQCANNARTHSNNVNHYKNEEELKTTCFSFELFWDQYGKKVDVKKCSAKYSKIKESDRQLIKDSIVAYVESEPDKQYRKNPATWLNGECWNNDIEEKKPQQNEKRQLKNLDKQMVNIFLTESEASKHIAEGAVNDRMICIDMQFYYNPFHKDNQ